MPTLSLAEMTETISRQKDYSLRARKQDDDEIGMLVDSLNEMLTQVQQREAALAETGKRAEARVKKMEKTLREKVKEIVERKRIEKALRESEERYRLYFESMTDLSYSIDPAFRITNVSPSVATILGYKPEELIGCSFSELKILAPEYLEKALADTMEILSGNKVTGEEYAFVTKEGRKKFGKISGAPLMKEDHTEAAIFVVRDITARKLMEANNMKLEE